ncbi:unnamed protein product, partial [Symbiodinium microadriaticum]
MLPTCFPGSRGNSVDAQIEKLNEVFKEWKLKFKEGVHLTAFTRDKLQFFDATSAFPAGTWSKAADTARIMKFIVYVCELQKDNVSAGGDKILHYIYRAASAISRFMKGAGYSSFDCKRRIAVFAMLPQASITSFTPPQELPFNGCAAKSPALVLPLTSPSMMVKTIEADRAERPDGCWLRGVPRFPVDLRRRLRIRTEAGGHPGRYVAAGASDGEA